MKKIFIVILALLLIIGCGSDEKKNETEGNLSTDTMKTDELPAEFTAAPDVDKESSFNLAYSIPAGEKLTYKLTSVVTTNQKIVVDTTMENEVTQTINYIISVVSKGQENSNTKLDITIESINISANFNGEILEYNSDKENDPETNLKFSEYSAFPKNTFQATINPQGRLVDVSNIDAIINKYLKLQSAPSIKDEERSQLNEQIKEQAVKPLVQQLFRYMPENETKIDSSWDLSYGSPMGLYTLTNTATSTLQDVVKKDDELIAKIGTKLSVTYKGDGYTKQGDVTYQFEKPKISGNATTYFNLEKNVVVKSELVTKTEVKVLVTSENPETGTETAKRTDLSVNRNYIELIEN